MQNGLYIVATPIGNLGDISPRAQEVLSSADIIACEDTRVSKKLFTLLGLSLQKQFICYQNYNEDKEADKLIRLISEEGKSIALISDAGSPLISDPGYKLIRRCREQGIYVTVLPGCCALICALQLSGLPTNKFMFSGFVPNKDKAREELFSSLKHIDATLVFYETANRIIKTLTAALAVFGNREMCVCREISKMYEESRLGSAAELIEHFSAQEPKGEMVFMVAPPAAEEKNADIDLDSLLREKLLRQNLKTSVKEIVELYGVNKNEVYEKALKIKEELKNAAQS